eukprot:9492964-Prorocentrum_lima.AAC.1
MVLRPLEEQHVLGTVEDASEFVADDQRKDTRETKNKVSMAEPVPPDKFAGTHTWIKGQVKGRIA